MQEKERMIGPFLSVAGAFGLLLGDALPTAPWRPRRYRRERRPSWMPGGECLPERRRRTECRRKEFVGGQGGFAKKEYEKAARLADRASIDAELARNKATTKRERRTLK